jgi:putative PIN family toxin of toxin-antitoxin system
VRIRVVLDTNVLVRALFNPQNPSGQLIEACETRRAVSLMSQPLWLEYQKVLKRAAQRTTQFSTEDFQLMLGKLRYLGEFAREVRVHFSFPRDRTDAKIIELALQEQATHIATYDLDLLSLPTSSTEAGKRFRQRLRSVAIARPEELIKDYPILSPG